MAAAGSTSMLCANANIPGLDGKHDSNLGRKEMEQGRCRSEGEGAEASAAIGTAKDGVRMDTLQEEMGKTLISIPWSLSS